MNLETKILIVDDQPTNLDLLIQTLQPQGCQVLSAPSGEVAVKIAPRTQPDLILLDILMPVLSGFDVCRQLKNDAQTQEIPIIFVTAKDDMASIVEGFQLGGIDYIIKYIIKPFQKEEVLVRVQTHLKISRLTKALSLKNLPGATVSGYQWQKVAATATTPGPAWENTTTPEKNYTFTDASDFKVYARMLDSNGVGAAHVEIPVRAWNHPTVGTPLLRLPFLRMRARLTMRPRRLGCRTNMWASWANPSNWRRMDGRMPGMRTTQNTSPDTSGILVRKARLKSYWSPSPVSMARATISTSL